MTTSTEPDTVVEPRKTVPPAPNAKDRVLAPVRALNRRLGAATVAFAVLATVFGALFAVLTPPFWGHDELTQFGRAYQVAHGGVFPQRIADDRGVAYGGDIPVSVDALMGYAFRDYNDNPDEPDAMVADPGAYDRLGAAEISSATKPMWFTNTAAYSPVPYVPAAVGIRLGEALGLNVGGMYLLTRLAGLVAYLGVVGFGLYALRERRSQWLVFTVAVLPIALFQAGTVTADTLTNALAIMVSALLLKALFVGDRLRPVETGALLAATIALPLSKPTYVLLAMLVVVVPADRLGFSGKLKLIPWVFAAVGGTLFLAWTKIASATGEGMGLMRPQHQWYEVRPGDQLKGILSDPVQFVHTFGESIALRDHRWFNQFFGELGFAYVDVPAISMLACLIAFAVSFGIADRMNSTTATFKRTLIVALTVLASVAMVYVTLYMSFTPVDFYIIDGVQGRYFVPLAIMGLAVIARWVPLRLTDAEGVIPTRGTAITVTCASLFALIAAAATYYTVVWG
ncbi:DUF2142 domain-containing protein [Nocardia asteroides]|uniref:DUF2142 domain-containing protein n=1 Tax=Nocardia asteroides TaxID=1824 RepID=UPI001E4E760F|nr:DUF2142 domain-containing protein [Nocardia asteroides]UGT52794.1 DUF2142 domain-containing protein [Nocardia asteroides]